MNKEIQENNNSVQTIETEEDHRGYALMATFDGETFRKIQRLKLNLKIEDNLLSRMQRMFARDKISYHEYQEIEKVIEVTQITGKHKLNLLTKPMIDQILRQEIGSTTNPRLSIEYGRNSIRKSISNRYSQKIETPNITKINGRIFNGTEWKNQEILIHFHHIPIG